MIRCAAKFGSRRMFGLFIKMLYLTQTNRNKKITVTKYKNPVSTLVTVIKVYTHAVFITQQLAR
jgi:hypothetical protein